MQDGNEEIRYKNDIHTEALSDENSCGMFQKEVRPPGIQNVEKCPYCPYRANKLDLLYTHITENHTTVTCYKCLECPYSHSQTSFLIDHINRQHQKIKFQCPDCKFKFTTLWNCEGHIMTRHPEKTAKLLEKLYHSRDVYPNNRKCPFCNFICTSCTRLKRHLEKSHTEVVTFKCLFCVYKSVDLNEIAKHMSAVHPRTDFNLDDSD